MADGAAPATRTFARHDPTTSVLFGVVRAHLASFVAAMREAGAALPRYVEQEFAVLLGCGVLACGFARVRCDGCGFERFVAFSCKCTVPMKSRHSATREKGVAVAGVFAGHAA